MSNKILLDLSALWGLRSDPMDIMLIITKVVFVLVNIWANEASVSLQTILICLMYDIISCICKYIHIA